MKDKRNQLLAKDGSFHRPTLKRKLMQFQTCDCRIDDHCLRHLRNLAGLAGPELNDAIILRGLRAVCECPCYMASHCIENICALVEWMEDIEQQEVGQEAAQ